MNRGMTRTATSESVGSTTFATRPMPTAVGPGGPDHLRRLPAGVGDPYRVARNPAPPTTPTAIRLLTRVRRVELQRSRSPFALSSDLHGVTVDVSAHRARQIAVKQEVLLSDALRS